jgi:peptidoglycan hydrolase CwlO-like protein
MPLLRKIIAVLVMILSMLGLLLCVAGLVGAWAVNTPATNLATGVLGTAGSYLDLAGKTLQTASATVSDVTQRLNSLSQTSGNLTAEQQAQIDARVKELTQPIATVSTLAATASQGLAGLDSTLTSLNAIPFVTVPQPEADLTGASERLASVSNSLDALYATINEANPDGSRVSAATGQLGSDLQRVQAQLDQWSSAIGQTQAALNAASSRLPRWIDLTSILVMLLAVAFGAGQVSLFVHALHWFKR